ncbi:MAG: cytochrome c [Anaerolineales bacterium]|nr:cytochrome c [Anaerolineales bacterium]
MKKYLILITMFLVTGCGAGRSQAQPPAMMGGGDSGMMARHHAQVPEQYAGLTSPDVTDDALLRGAGIYKINCLACHGETAAGDSVAGAALDPFRPRLGILPKCCRMRLSFTVLARVELNFKQPCPPGRMF